MTNNNLDPLTSRLKPIVSAVRNSLGVVVLAAPLLVFPDTVEAAFVPVTDEQVVNSETSGDQSYPSMAMDADGDFVVVWVSDGKGDDSVGDGDDGSIHGQRFNADGDAQGDEFQVNSYTTGWQTYPSVAMDADGDFVVVWESFGQDGDNTGIYGRRYNDNGVALDTEFLVNSHTISRQNRPSVAMDADGDFVVVWQSYNQDGFYESVFGQRYNAAGVAQGTEFPVNSATTGRQEEPSVAMDADGNFVVAWTSDGKGDDSVGDGDNRGISGQRYNFAGVPQDGEFQVNSYATDDQDSPSVAMDADGDFVVVWQSYNQDGSYESVFGQRYNVGGVTQGGEFPVNSYTTGWQNHPSVAMDALGNFAVVWQSYDTPPDSDDYGVFARTYRASGTPDQSKEFLVNQEVLGNQRRPVVAMDDDGDNMAIAWDSYADPAPPGRSGSDVILRTYHETVPTAVPTQSMVHTGLLAGLLALLGLGAQRRRLRPKRE